MTVFSKLKKSDANRKSVALAILLHLLGVVGDSEPPACMSDGVDGQCSVASAETLNPNHHAHLLSPTESDGEHVMLQFGASVLNSVRPQPAVNQNDLTEFIDASHNFFQDVIEFAVEADGGFGGSYNGQMNNIKNYIAAIGKDQNIENKLRPLLDEFSNKPAAMDEDPKTQTYSYHAYFVTVGISKIIPLFDVLARAVVTANHPNLDHEEAKQQQKKMVADKVKQIQNVKPQVPKSSAKDMVGRSLEQLLQDLADTATTFR